jgi:hypothetical protein
VTAQFCQFEAGKKFQHGRTIETTHQHNARGNMSEKKRKRREEGGERPKKKVAIAPQGTVQVELLENKETLGPLLGMRKAIHIT